MSTRITTPPDPVQGATPRKTGPARWVRILLPAVLILIWLAAAGVGGPYFGKVGEVSSNDQTAYLPESSDATQVQQQLGEFSDSDSIPAVVVMVGDEPLTDQEIAELNTVVAGLTDLEGVGEDVSPAIPSEDGLAVQAFVPIDSGEAVADVVDKLSETLSDQTPDNVATYVTGPAGFSADLGAAFAGIDGLLLAVALAAVLVIDHLPQGRRRDPLPGHR